MEVAWELYLAFEDLLVDGHRIIVVEWVDTGDHLVSEDAERPPVNWLAVPFVEEHLGGEVLGRAAKSIRARLAVLGKAEIGQAQIALVVDENVLWLQVAVNDVQRVKVLEHQSDLR